MDNIISKNFYVNHSLQQTTAHGHCPCAAVFLGVNIVFFGGQPKQYIIGKRISEAAGSESVTPIACKGFT